MDKTRSVKYPQITEADYAGKLVSELDDRPQLLPSELKARFDALGKEVIIPALNTLSQNTEQISERLVASDGTLFRFGVTEDGKPGYVITDEAGADTVVPFSSGGDATALYEALQYSGLVTEDMPFDEMCEALAGYFPAILDLYVNGVNSGEFVAYTGGISFGGTAPTATFGTTLKASITSVGGQARNGTVISKPLDLSAHKVLKLSHSSKASVANNLLFVKVQIVSAKAEQMGNAVVLTENLLYNQTSTSGDVAIDISEVSGENYIAIEICCNGALTVSTEISNIQLYAK